MLYSTAAQLFWAIFLQLLNYKSLLVIAYCLMSNRKRQYRVCPNVPSFWTNLECKYFLVHCETKISVHVRHRLWPELAGAQTYYSTIARTRCHKSCWSDMMRMIWFRRFWANGEIRKTITLTNEPCREGKDLWELYEQERSISACAFVQSHQSLHYCQLTNRIL